MICHRQRWETLRTKPGSSLCVVLYCIIQYNYVQHSCINHILVNCQNWRACKCDISLTSVRWLSFTAIKIESVVELCVWEWDRDAYPEVLCITSALVDLPCGSRQTLTHCLSLSRPPEQKSDKSHSVQMSTQCLFVKFNMNQVLCYTSIIVGCFGQEWNILTM